MIVSYYRSLLIAESAINTAVSGRIYPLSLPQDKTLPSIVLSQTNHIETAAKDHNSILTVQLWCASTTSEYGYDMMHRIGKLIRDTLNSHTGSNASYYINNTAHKGDIEDQSDDGVVFIMNSDYDVVWRAK